MQPVVDSFIISILLEQLSRRLIGELITYAEYISNACTKAKNILGFLRRTQLFSCPSHPHDMKEPAYKFLSIEARSGSLTVWV